MPAPASAPSAVRDAMTAEATAVAIAETVTAVRRAEAKDAEMTAAVVRDAARAEMTAISTQVQEQQDLWLPKLHLRQKWKGALNNVNAEKG